jgi:hypothetical protein
MKTTHGLISISVIAAVAGVAMAAPLPPGAVHHHPALNAPPDYTNTLHPGNLLLATMTSSMMQGTGHWATLTSEVFQGSSGLVFVYSLVNDGSPPQRLSSMTVAGPWGNHIIDAGAHGSMTGGPTQAAPMSVGNQATHVNATWSIGNELAFGSSSQFWFATNVNAWTISVATVLDGPAGSAQGLAFTLIPLPSAGLMGLAGFGLLALRRRSR